MSKVKWIRGPICGIDNCRARLYMRNAGRKVCQFGHVAEGDFDIEADEDEAYSQTKRLNVQLTDTGFGSLASSQIQTTSIINSKSSDKVHGEEQRLLVYKCLQLLLRKITPKVLRYLFEYLGEKAVESLHTSVEPILKLLWIRCVKESYESISPTIVDLYAIIYLALRHLNRFPLFVDQYLEMIAKNKVPFFNAKSLLPREMLNLLPITSAWFFSGTESLHGGTFYTYVSKWMHHLGMWSLRPAPLNFSYPIVYKLLNDLRIPHVPQILSVYHELAQNITGGHFTQTGKFSAITVPEAQVVGLVQYSIRLYLIASKEIMDIKQWGDWIASDEEIPCFYDQSQHMSTEEIMDLSEQQASAYLDWVYDNIVQDNHKDPDSEVATTTERNLAKIFPYVRSGSTPSVTKISKPVEAAENVLSPSDLADVENKLEKFLCSRYGMTPAMLMELCARIEYKLIRRIRSRHIMFMEEDGSPAKKAKLPTEGTQVPTKKTVV